MLIYGLQQLLPGDPAIVLAGEDRDPSVVAYLRENCISMSRCRSATPTG
jgi:hypothetical protein